MKIEEKKLYPGDKERIIYVGNVTKISIDYDDVDRLKVDKIVDILIKSLKENLK